MIWPWQRHKPVRIEFDAELACPKCGHAFSIHFGTALKKQPAAFEPPTAEGQPKRNLEREAATERAYRAKGPLIPAEPPEF